MPAWMESKMISRNVFDGQLPLMEEVDDREYSRFVVQFFDREVRYMVATRDPCYLEPGYVYVHVIKTCFESEIDALIKELSKTHGMAGYASKYGNIPMFEFKERLTNVAA